MRTSKALLIAGGIAILAIGSTTAPAEAQCTRCTYCYFGGAGHDAPPDGGSMGSIHYDCLAPITCSHPPCGVALLPEDEQEREAIDALMNRVADGDEYAVTVALREHSDHVYFNRDRSALQAKLVAPCEGEPELVAHIPLTGAQLAVALAAPTQRDYVVVESNLRN